MGIVNKIGWITTDNTSNNNTMMTALQQLIQEHATCPVAFDQESNHIQCMAHIYNLAVVDILKQLVQKPAFDRHSSLQKICVIWFWHFVVSLWLFGPLPHNVKHSRQHRAYNASFKPVRVQP
ncbi:hypothetical protein CALCODRAFT_484386 [Calocera cornea HHB12733]|uniref:hAT-like transposase RNase-H fold domain-containing protein n=1 Tax=Calocera cornea HHB12733 TaxID=1353952 RepID=A0A165F128_9BASI|nr:hypothetical protein CALCODRAFT_484386 [Calocera cornea HHB12733]